MANRRPASDPLLSTIALIFQYPLRWMFPAACIAGAAVAYAYYKQDVWEASQAMMVRSDATSKQNASDDFRNMDEMKRVEETILEVAMSRSVIEGVLREVGAPIGSETPASEWPADTDIEQLRKRLEIKPPKGAEFGATEVIYLKAQDPVRDRAIDIVTSLESHLQREFNKVRRSRAAQTISELETKVKLAEEELAVTSKTLQRIEEEAGENVLLLRMLERSTTGQIDVINGIAVIQAKLRDIREQESVSDELLAQLRKAQENPDQPLATPAVMLSNLPELARMKQALTDLQVRAATMSGTGTIPLPLIQEARDEEEAVRQEMHKELGPAIHSVESDLRLTRQRREALEEERDDLRERLRLAAAQRAEYSNALSLTTYAQDFTADAHRQLIDARGRQGAMENSSLIHALGEPETGTSPVGLGFVQVIVAGVVGGLAIGFGFLFLTAAPALPLADDTPSFSSERRTYGPPRVAATGGAPREEVFAT
ncbi:MAG: hypothetical protein KDA42_05260 [Planctomycetales bacterium]|nr:hypothetical protein [Planctomycetales bacterium]